MWILISEYATHCIKKKRKLGSSMLVLGTGGGDVLAFDVAAGQLKWRVNNCHPG